jgi:mono/diheme cytochrome c family protein
MQRLFWITRSTLAAFPALLVVVFAELCFAETIAARGEALAEKLCATCHSIRARGESPHAAAPAFRILGNQMEIGDLSRRLRRGLLTGHEDMPMFRFKRDDADALAAYVRSVQGF